MQIDKLMLVPQREQIGEFVQLAREYGCGFEYNDFFMPDLLDDDKRLSQCIKLYQRPENRPSFSTVHGAFLDVTVFSDDAKIREVSDLRVTQSLEIAKQLGAVAVIFHTNYIPNFNLESYRKNWISRNAAYFSQKLEEYPTINIYMENMFDTDCRLLAGLGEKMRAYPNFGICLDYAHAQAFGDEKELDVWVETLAPYVRHLHINDNDFVSDLHLAPGDGKIDWKRFQTYYEQYFKDASVLLEVTGIEKTKKSLKYLSCI